MIEKNGDFYILACDICGAEPEESFVDFEEAVAFKVDRSNGWTSRKNSDGSWEELCPTCNDSENF